MAERNFARHARRALGGTGRHERRYRVGGALYVIRDIYVGGRFLACEYAQPNPNGSTKWLPCIEGVEFSDILPLRVHHNG